MSMKGSSDVEVIDEDDPRRGRGLLTTKKDDVIRSRLRYVDEPLNHHDDVDERK
jgi:hypothetical protein